MMLFKDAFEQFIKGRSIIDCGFGLLRSVKQPGGYFMEIGGYHTTFDNGYRIYFSGGSLGETPVQEAMIVDPGNIVIARDTDDLRWPAGNE